MKRLLTAIMTLVFVTTFHMSTALASSLTVHPVKVSVKETVVEREDGQVLKQNWYGTRFYLNTNEKSPVDYKAYEEALQEVNYPTEGLDSYQVYVLPYTLEEYKNVLAYTFKDNSTVVFATMQLTNQQVHWLAVHELGHAVDFKYMNKEKWAQYKKLRGITDENKYNNNADHKNQPREIFAEDFRILFGGDKAVKMAHENSALSDPREVEGLKEFYLSLV